MNIRPAAEVLHNYNEIAELCLKTSEPVLLTQNDKDDLVIMSRKSYEEKFFLADVYNKLIAAEEEIVQEKTHNAQNKLNELRAKYGL